MKIISLARCVLWTILVVIMGVRVFITMDNFPYISLALLKDSLPRIISRPTSLYNLLRIKEVHEYHIALIVADACATWPIKIWEIVGRLIENRPRLASILVSFKCLESLTERINFLPAKFDTSLPDRYGFAARLSSLPLKLGSEDDITLFLKNFWLVDEFERRRWLDKNTLIASIDAMCKSQRILYSGLTHQFRFKKILADPKARKKYFILLEKIDNPIDLFGHLARLRQRLIFDQKNQKSLKTTILGHSIKNAIQYIEGRLLENSRYYNMRSIEAFFYLLDPMSPKDMTKWKFIINRHLQNYSTADFYQLVEFAASKLGGACGNFLSETNRDRLLGDSRVTVFTWEFYFDQRTRISFFHRWRRGLFKNILPASADMNDSLKFLEDNFYALPPEANGTSLLVFLDALQYNLIEYAEQQLVIKTLDDNVTHINAEDFEDEFRTLEMTLKTQHYILISLAKQIYFQSPEIFEQGVLGWIKALARKSDASDTIKMLKEKIGQIYPFTPSITHIDQEVSTHCAIL